MSERRTRARGTRLGEAVLTKLGLQSMARCFHSRVSCSPGALGLIAREELRVLTLDSFLDMKRENFKSKHGPS